MRAIMPLLCVVTASLAAAQVGGLRLPQLPGAALPSVPAVTGGLEAGNGELDARQLEALRTTRIRELLRRHGDLLEADAHGAPFVRGEVLSLSPPAAALAAASAAGFTVVREENLAGIGLQLVVLHAGAHTAQALRQLQAADPQGLYDFNHLYLDGGATAGASAALAAEGAAGNGTVAGSDRRVGLIDSGVAGDHEVFAGQDLHRHGCGGRSVPGAHGTAVASLLVGNAPALHGAAPAASLYAADVFCGEPTGGAASAVAEAFAWLAEQHVAVINVSLVGPPDTVLERVVHEVVSRGHLVVAAVGNDGPAAPPLYPASWPGVIGVTAVDAKDHALVEAARGPQVKFAAPGADMAAARLGGGYVRVRGTSFAAPIVAGLLALSVRSLDPTGADEAVAALAHTALHPGKGPSDLGYGYGLVGTQLREQPALAAARSTN